MFSSGRRRTILILFITSLILITLDIRGNAAFDAVRGGFGYVLAPFEAAGRVVARPIENTWAGITEVDDLRNENRNLRDQLDKQRSDQISAQNALANQQELKDLIGLESLSGFDRIAAETIGASPSNFDQKVEINRGSLDGIEVGMPVVNSAGLVGKITKTYLETSDVLLVTDPEYFVRVKVVGVEDDDATTEVTTPSGIATDELDDAVSEVTTDTSNPDETTTSSNPDETTTSSNPDETTTSSDPDEATTETDPASNGDEEESTGDEEVVSSGETTSTTTTTIPSVDALRETGQLNGKGGDRLPQVEFVADAPQFGRIREGDAVLTAGGRLSLAPPDIPVGRVLRITSTGGSEGLRIEVELSADVSRLNFLEVVLYKPPTELGGQ